MLLKQCPKCGHLATLCFQHTHLLMVSTATNQAALIGQLKRELAITRLACNSPNSICMPANARKCGHLATLCFQHTLSPVDGLHCNQPSSSDRPAQSRARDRERTREHSIHGWRAIRPIPRMPASVRKCGHLDTLWGKLVHLQASAGAGCCSARAPAASCSSISLC